MQNHLSSIPANLATLLFAIGVLAVFPVHADVLQDFERGATAHRHGDYQTAVKLWRPLAEKGILNAQFNLGQMYRFGDGVARDYSEALKWYRKAAEQGDKESQYNLGIMYLNGEGVEKNEAEAHRWFTLNHKQHSHKDHAQYQAWVRQAAEILAEDERRASYKASLRNGERVLADLRARAGLAQPGTEKKMLALGL